MFTSIATAAHGITEVQWSLHAFSGLIWEFLPNRNPPCWMFMEFGFVLSYFVSQDLVKSRSREIGCYNDCIALKFDKLFDSVAAEVLIKFQSE